MTDKQFNYILRRLRNDILRSMNDKSFLTENDGVYVDGVVVICVDDVYNILNTYFEELIEND